MADDPSKNSSLPPSDHGSGCDDAPTQDSTQSDKGVSPLAFNSTAPTLDAQTLYASAGGSHLDRVPPAPSHYQLFGLLGRGGMGMVYKALDTRLNRYVALKFMIAATDDAVARFQREARAQARVDHENICRVYEVGQFEGHLYIAMQLISGQSLDRLGGSLSLEEKLLVIMRVASALQAAHRAGLVHRDLKPGNIMVERGDDGDPKPYVLDFGLARSTQDQNLTMSGAVLGTPGYMAPEQARGEMDLIDRRTDVYGLGATLYHLLTRHPPFKGASPATVLMDILNKDPEKPRDSFPSIPVDIETIVLKCLEKRPEDRYSSTRALADDLSRYLNGDPIQARPAGVWLKTVKLIRKHKALFAMAAVSLFLVSAALGWGLVRSRQKERLARLFTSQVKEIISESRLSYLSRRHQIGPDRRRLQERMSLIQSETDRYGNMAAGAGNYALGWGYLTQARSEEALRHFQKSWDKGFRDPDAAYALGLVYSNLYRQALAQSQLQPDSDERERLGRLARERYRNPALQYMKKAEGASIASPQYSKALIAYIEERYDDATALLSEAEDTTPWFYEIPFLEAELLRARAESLGRKGDRTQARQLFEKSLAAFDHAIDLAQSDPELYKAQVNTLGLIMLMDMFGSEDLSRYLDKALVVLAQCREILPGDGETFLLEARLYYYLALRLSIEGRDPEAQLALGETAAGKALAAGADPSLVQLNLAQIYACFSKWRSDRKLDAREMVDKTIGALELVAEKDRGIKYYYYLASAWKTKAAGLTRMGENACAAFEASLEASRQILALKPHGADALYNLATTLYSLSDMADCVGHSGMALLKEAAAYLEKAVDLNPNHIAYNYQLGRVLRNMALGGSSVYQGRLDGAVMDRALAAFGQCRVLNPRIVQPIMAEGWAYHCRALFDWEYGGSPHDSFSKALEIYESGLDQFPGHSRLTYYKAATLYFRGKLKVREGLSPGGDLENAITLCRQTLESGKDQNALIVLGSAFLMLGEREVQNGASAQEPLARARDAFQQILDFNPSHTEGHRGMARFFTLKALGQHQQGQDPISAFEQGRESLDRARASDSKTLAVQLADVRWCLSYGAYLGTRADKGFLDHVSDLKTQLEPWLYRPEALAAKAGLGVLENSLAGKSDAKAADHLNQALQQNPNLVHEWGSLLKNGS